MDKILKKKCFQCSGHDDVINEFKNVSKIISKGAINSYCSKSTTGHFCASEFIVTLLTAHQNSIATLFSSGINTNICSSCFLKVYANIKNFEFVLKALGIESIWAPLLSRNTYQWGMLTGESGTSQLMNKTTFIKNCKRNTTAQINQSFVTQNF